MALCSIVVAAGIVGVAAVIHRVMWRRRFARFGAGPMAFAACGPGFGGPFGGWSRGPRGGWHGGGPRGLGQSFWLRRVFERLDTTPGQEREIRAAVSDFREATRSAKEGLSDSREALARAIAEDTFDEIAMGEASVKLDATTGQVKEAFEAALRRVHAVLDPKQREQLAELVSKGPFRGFGRHPYRGG